MIVAAASARDQNRGSAVRKSLECCTCRWPIGRLSEIDIIVHNFVCGARSIASSGRIFLLCFVDAIKNYTLTSVRTLIKLRFWPGRTPVFGM
jgi:hypothetical protein